LSADGAPAPSLPCRARSPPCGFLFRPIGNPMPSIVWAAKSYRDLLWRLRQEQDRRQLLNHELGHRIRNTLAIVQSVIGQTLRDQPAALVKLNDRIAALAATNDLLVKSEWRGAFLRRILAAEFAPFDQARFHLDGTDFECPAEAATVLALIFHELTTNAAKYGALSEINGHVEIRWVRVSHDRQRLTWTEAGGPVITPPTRLGFGTQVMETLIKLDLGGELRFDWRAKGLICEIELQI
jgi:two-component sensor histidine kinase